MVLATKDPAIENPYQAIDFYLVEAGTPCFEMEGKNIVVNVSMAKYWIYQMAMRVADGCVQLHGGYGYCEEYPITRAWRDAKVLSIFAGTSKIMKNIAAQVHGTLTR